MTDATERLIVHVLVLRCQTGDETAFDELVQLYSPRLRLYLRKILGDADQADDALQEVLWAVYRGMPKLSDAAAFSTWIYRIARDRAFRDLRRRRRPEYSVEQLELVASDNGEFCPEDVQQIHAALDTLAPEHREVLMLRFLEEMKYDDIARITGCPVGTIRSRIYYAKLALRHAIEGTKRP